jgi:hypothetical protein
LLNAAMYWAAAVGWGVHPHHTTWPDVADADDDDEPDELQPVSARAAVSAVAAATATDRRRRPLP